VSAISERPVQRYFEVLKLGAEGQGLVIEVGYHLDISGGKGKVAIANHFHDHVDHVSIRQQSQQLADEAAVPYSVVGCCEVDKHNSGLFSWKAILDVLCQQGDLV